MVSLAAPLLFASCAGGTGPADARRAELVLRVSHDGLATLIGRSLDWPGTWVPGAVVIIQRSGDSTLSAVADERGTVFVGGFLELYNNSDSTILLAGKLLLYAFPGWHDSPNWPCTSFSGLMADREGLWAEWIFEFPPNSPPLARGQVAVVATDAVNHRIYGGDGFVDLSDADFEWRGPADADNPNAVDLVSVGPRDYSGSGHGIQLHQLRSVFAVAHPVDLASMPTQRSANDLTFVRVPTSAILDVASWKMTYTSAYPECEPSVARDLDALEARLLDQVDTRSMVRRPVGNLPGGQLLLQWTRSTAADFRVSTPTPGTVP